jgi:hypothetical protein
MSEKISQSNQPQFNFRYQRKGYYEIFLNNNQIGVIEKQTIGWKIQTASTSGFQFNGLPNDTLDEIIDDFVEHYKYYLIKKTKGELK